LTLKDAGIEGGLGDQSAQEEANCYNLPKPDKRVRDFSVPLHLRWLVQIGLSHDLRPPPDNALGLLP